jgi:glycosyltransferase involved in cell wall biosynthesis
MPAKISVITPVYNAISTLEATLKSVVAQNYPDMEYWLIDGLSTDGSLEIIKEYAQKYHFIHFISEKDKGIYDAMNKGVRLAEGEWLYFLGADDTLRLNVFFEINTSLEKADFLYGNVVFMPSMMVYNGRFDIKKLINHNICHQAIFIRKAVFNKKGLFDTQYRIYADWEYNWRCFADKHIRIQYVDKIIADYAETGASANAGDERFYHDKETLLLKYFSLYKYTYEYLGDKIFNIFHSYSLIKAWMYIILGAVFMGRYFYYLRNGFYWTLYRLKASKKKSNS